MKKILFFLSKKKFLLINFFIFLYIAINFLDGNRGYFSYVQKKNTLIEKEIKVNQLRSSYEDLKNKNLLLSDNLNLDYLDQLYRDYFTLGKKGEKLYLLKN
jgi:cell division protein DivIC